MVATMPDIFSNTMAGNAARQYFAIYGLPNRRNEDFHYTDISRALAENIESTSVFYEYPAPKGDIEIRFFESEVRFYGQIDGVEISPYEPQEQTEIFDKLIGGIAKSAQKVLIKDNCEASISIIRFGNSRAIIDFEIGNNAKVTITEIQEAGGLNAFSSTINIGAGSRIEFISKLKGGGTDLSNIRVNQAPNSELNVHLMSLGGKMTRRNFDCALNGENAKAKVNGVYLLNKTHFDFFSNITHNAPNCESAENIRGLANEGAQAIFQGKIFVSKGAKKTIGNMEHRGLMLEDGARIFAKPNLEIYNDDVECSHANTIGAIDESALFYMQSRGISKARAKTILMQAFLESVFDDLPDSESIIADLEYTLEAMLNV